MSSYIAFAGVDGSGKTTHARLLVEALRERGRDAVFVPSESMMPTRTMLNDVAKRRGLSDYVELLGPDTARLLAAVHKWNSLTTLREALDTGDRIVVTDRGVLCQYAVVRVFDGRNEDLIRDIFSDVPTPEVTIFIDVPGKVAVKRLAQRGEISHSAEELDSLARAYVSLPEARQFVIVDGSGNVDAVRAAVLDAVDTALFAAEADVGDASPGAIAGDDKLCAPTLRDRLPNDASR